MASSTTIGYDAFSDTESFAVALKQGLEKAAADLGCVTIKALVDNADAATAVQNAKVLAQQKVDGAILFNVIQAASRASPRRSRPRTSRSCRWPSRSTAIRSSRTTTPPTACRPARRSARRSRHPASPAGVALIGRFDDQDSTKQRMDGVIQGLKNTAPKSPSRNTRPRPTARRRSRRRPPCSRRCRPDPAILISAPNDDLTYASFQAVKQANRLDHAFAMGIGGVNPVGLDYVCKNKDHYIGTVGFFPENWPKYLLPALMATIQGATNVPVYPAKIVVPTEVITPANVKTFYPDYTC